MRKLIILISFAVATISANAQENFYTSTETKYWDATKTYTGYTLFGTRGVSYLIDMEGHVVHTWNIGTNPRFTEGGTLLDAVGGNPSNQNQWKELDWKGNTLWSYTETRSNYHGHHDFVKIYNPELGDSTFMFIANKDLTAQQCLDAGCDPANNYTGAQMDAIVEVNKQGVVIWEWCFFDHVVQDLNTSKSTFGVIANTPGRINLNIPGNPVKSDWMHCNSMDYNQKLNMVVINSVHGEFYVVDHGKTFVPNNPDSSKLLAASSLGDFVYRFGDPAKYNRGNPPSVVTNWEKSTTGHKQIGGAHNIQWIRPGLPGEGNFMVFNNAENLFELTPQSYIVEINPYLNSSGVNTANFVNPPDAGYNVLLPSNMNLMKEKKNISKQIVWMFSSKNNTSFYSTIGSSAQRLPNGNTLVCSMNDGHFFEVKPSDTSVVWEYINPMTRDGVKRVKVDNYPTYNGVFRAYRYTAEHPALVGQALTPGNTMTGATPNYFVPADLLLAVQPHNHDDNTEIDNTNYPNPFSINTNISFHIENPAAVEILIYDDAGNLVRNLLNKNLISGDHNFVWDACNGNGNTVAEGSYYYILKVNQQTISKKIIHIQ